MFKSINRDEELVAPPASASKSSDIPAAMSGDIVIAKCLKKIDHRFTMHITVDKHQYKPGETAHIRGILLNEFTHCPGMKYFGEETFNFRVVGPSGSVVLGGDDVATPGHKKSVIAVDWVIPEGTPGGEYKVEIGKQFYEKKEMLEDEKKSDEEETEGEDSKKDDGDDGSKFEFYPGSAATMQIEDNVITRIGRNGWKGLVRMKVTNPEVQKFKFKVGKSHSDKSGIFLGIIGENTRQTEIWKSQGIADIKGYPQPGDVFEFHIHERENRLRVFKNGKFFGEKNSKLRNFKRPLYMGIFLHYNGNQVTFLPPTKGGFFPVASRKFDIMNYAPPKFKMNLEFEKKGYGEGDTVKATLKVERSEGGAPERCEIEASARVDGDEVFRKTYECTTGTQDIVFELPKSISAGEGTLNCAVTEGVTENKSKTIPIILKKLDCKVFPEGGDLVVGCVNGCYVQAYTLYGEPADFAGFLIEKDVSDPNSIRPVVEVKTEHEGRGFFSFVPKKGKKYHIKVLQPMGISVPVDLPEIKDTGLSIRLPRRSSVPFGTPIEISVCASEKMETKIGLYKKDKVVDMTGSLKLEGGEIQTISLNPKDVDGVLRVTAFFLHTGFGVTKLTFPVAERLIFVKPKGVLDLELESPKLVYSPGERVELKVRPRIHGRSVPAIVCCTVTDDSVIQMQEKRKRPPRLVEQVYLENEVEELRDCTSYIYQEEENKVAADTCADLLLGTQGWRRFVYKVAKENEKFYELEKFKDTEKEFFFRMLNLPNPEYFARKQRIERLRLERMKREEEEKRRMELEAEKRRKEQEERRRREEREEQERYRVSSSSSSWGGSFTGYGGGGAPPPSYGVRRSNMQYQSAAPSARSGGGGLSFMMKSEKKKKKKKGGFFAKRRAGREYEEEERYIPRSAPRAVARGRGRGRRGPSRPQRDGRSVPGAPPPRRIAPPSDPVMVMEDAMPSRVMQEMSVRRPMPAPGDLFMPPPPPADEPVLPPPPAPPSYTTGRIQPLRPKPAPVVSVNVVEYAREYAHAAKPGNERTDFTETVFFSPYRETEWNEKSESHESVLQFCLSDSVTSFVVRVDAFTLSGSVGSSSSFMLKSQKPFYLSPKLPLELSMADEVRVPLGIVNNLPLESNCRVQWDVSGTQMELRNPNWTGPVKAGERKVEYFDLKVKSAYVDVEKQVVNVTGHLDDFRMEDSVSKEVSVKPYGFLTCVPFAGVLQSGDAHEYQLDIDPETFVPFSFETIGFVTPSSLGSLLTTVKGLVRQPGGCFEQVAAKLYPMTLAKQFLLAQNQPLDSRIERYMKTGYDKLIGYEIRGGGFDWYGRAPANESLSALGLCQFIELCKCFSIDPNVIDRTRRWLLSRRNGSTFRKGRGRYAYGHASKFTTNVYIVWSLSRAGGTYEEVEEVVRDIHQNGTFVSRSRKTDCYVSALLSLSYYNFSKYEESMQLARMLVSEQKEDGSLNECTDTITRSGGRNKTLECTALACLAWMNFADEGFQKNITNAVNYLVKNNQGGCYGSSQATVLSLQAIIKYFGDSTDSDGTVDLEMNGMVVSSLSIPKHQNRQVDFADFSRAIRTDGTPNKLCVRSKYGSRLPYSLAIWYKMTIPSNEQENLPFSFSTEMKNTTLKEGDVTEIEVTLENKTDDADGLPMVIAIVAIPSGCEVRMEKLKELKKMEKFAYFELFGARNVVFYWRGMAPNEKKKFSFDVSASFPGKFRGDSSRAYLYYDNDVKFYVPGMECEIATK